MLIEKVKKFTKSRFVFFILGVIATLFVVHFIFTYVDASQVILRYAENSPSNKHTVVAYTRMGGGAAGYCDSYVSVVPWDEFQNYTKERYTIVSSRQCSASNTTIEWIDANTLRVKGLHDLYQREEKNSDKQVKIVY